MTDAIESVYDLEDVSIDNTKSYGINDRKKNEEGKRVGTFGLND